MSMKKGDADLLNMVNRKTSHFDHADAVVDETPIPNKTRLGSMRGNPPFIAQFDLEVLVKYFTVAGGVYTSRTAAYILANHAALATKQAAFLFSQSDFQGGFKKSQGQFPLNGGWLYEAPFIYGVNGYQNAATSFGVLDATARAQLQVGDLVNVATAIVAGPINVVALTIVRCAQVSYGTLLASLSSDMFTMNNIRYTLPDTSTAGLLQYNNQLYIQLQTLLGKYNSDFISPTSLKQPDQFQNGIIDVPIEKSIDKNVGIASYINYDSVDQVFSVFVKLLNKFAA